MLHNRYDEVIGIHPALLNVSSCCLVDLAAVRGCRCYKLRDGIVVRARRIFHTSRTTSDGFHGSVPMVSFHDGL